MNQVYLKMCVFVFLQLFLNISHFRAVDKNIFVQNNLHVLPVRIIECYQFRNVLSVRFSNGSQLLSDNDGGNTHVTCTKPKIDKLPRTVLHGLSAGTVIEDGEICEIDDKFKILLQVVLPAGNDKEIVVLVDEILVVGPIPVIGGTN
jgi:hypothetical protein